MILGLLTLLSTLAWGAEPGQAEDAAVQHAMDQAKLFTRRGWVEDARAELEAAAATPAGAESAALWWALAGARLTLCDAEGAWLAAERAAALTKDEAARAEALTFAADLRGQHGVLTVSAPHDGMFSRLQLEPQSMLLNPEHKRCVEALSLTWTHGVSLPARVALPQGEYAVQGQTVTVSPSAESSLPLSMSQLGAKGFSALQVSRLELASGVSTLFGPQAAHYAPSLELQVAFTQPVAGWLIGATVDWSARSWVMVEAGPAGSARSVAGGLRLGRELMIGGPLALRPTLGYRYGVIPGVALGCVGGSGEGLSCDTSPAPSDDWAVYASALAHIPTAELSMNYRRAGRTTALGLGVRAGVDLVLGAPQSPGQAQATTRELTVVYTVQDDAAFRAVGLRMLAEVSVAFR
ncbi:MAG: hypothetical protein IPO67_20785 [Deltaproteobacteria bacterium]|nr:hypothetical protein [Deltaproteobacteria bacterium]